MRLSQAIARKAISVLIMGCGACATAVSADQLTANIFQGFDVGVGAAVQSFSYGGGSQVNVDYPSHVEYFSGVGKTGFNAVFDVGYNFTLPVSHWVLGVQAALEPLHAAGATTQKTPGTVTQERVNNRYGFSVLPGYLITPNTLIYGKIGYSLASEHINNQNDRWSGILRYKGYTAGFGVKSFALSDMLGVNNLYAFAEYNYASYGSQSYNVFNGYDMVVSTGLKLHANEGVLGVGYVF